MKSSRLIAAAVAISCAMGLAGCQTAQNADKQGNRIRVTNGAFNGGSSALSGDIKSILMAGGLDTSNPSAPTSDTSKSEVAKSIPVASDTQAIVAALSSTSSTSAAQTAKPTSVPASMSVAETQPSAALAMVEPPKPRPAPQKKVIMEAKVVHEEASPPIELASINMSSSSDGEAFDPIPPAEMAKAAPIKLPEAKVAKSPRAETSSPVASSEKTSRVRRF